MGDDQFERIPVGNLHEPHPLLRPVNKDSIEYLERLDSIQRHGILQTLLVRPSSRQPGKYEIVDGMWRFTAAEQLGLETIPCIIRTGLTDDDVLALQIQANAVRADTTPLEYSRQLRRILDVHPLMTITELSALTAKNLAWVKDRLGLLTLSRAVQLMVDRGEIPTMSAYMLAKIPRSWRKDYIDHAKAMKSKDFCAMAAGVIKAFTECIQKGKMDERYLPEFVPQPYLRNVKEINAELDNSSIGALLLVTESAKTSVDGFRAALKWVLHMDSRSIQEQRTAFDRRAHAKLIIETETHD